MLKTGWCAAVLVALVCVSMVAGCGSGGPFNAALLAINFETTAVPAGGAGQLYDVLIVFSAESGAALPDQFGLVEGVLPPGVRLLRETDANGDFTGNARLLGFPRETGSFSFTIKAISTGELASNVEQPDLAVESDFVINVGLGSIAILSPTAAEGTIDPELPAFPARIPFVNPANPNAFFSYAWEVAGGSNNNRLNVYIPREFELSTFDAAVVADDSLIDMDLDESGGGDKFNVNFADGGLFAQQAGENAVQIGGFQSPRGPVGTLTRYAGGAGLDPDWFQPAGVPTGLSGIQGATGPVAFSLYTDPSYRDTHPDAAPRAKYPFPMSEYDNAFRVPAGPNENPLQFRLLVEAIDTNGTLADKTDDTIARRAYEVEVEIPDIVIDTVVLPDGTAGVDYNEFVNASGGVPPLKYQAEYADGVANTVITENGAGDLTRTDFGLGMDEVTGQFIGVPRASGNVDVTVRVFASVMNVDQNGPLPVDPVTKVPVALPISVDEFAGRNPITEPVELDPADPAARRGIHKTFTISMAAPSMPAVANGSLVPGVDGFTYPGDRIVGTGGVPRLVPYPVDFVGTYPAATALRNYTWTASYIRDASHGAGEGTPDPARELPNDLSLDGDEMSITGGQITGDALDRGFHPVTFMQTDCFWGPAAGPEGPGQTVPTTLALSISPDTIVFGRGKQTAEGAGGEPTGLLDSTIQTGEQRMVPMMLAIGLYTVETGQLPQQCSALPDQFDFLPVMIINGGSDDHNRKSIPSITGFWPAESNFANAFVYNSQRAWGHVQQELVWAQVPNDTHRRVFFWGETETKKWVSTATTGGFSKRYQQYDPTGERGIMVLDPLTGDVWFPAVLSNSLSGTNDEGSQFGAQVVIGRKNEGRGFTSSGIGVGYWKFYERGQTDSRWDRELLAVGLGSYIESWTTSASSSVGYYRTTQGRSAISLAMSADGEWCATALPGGTDEQKFLLWRTVNEDLSVSHPTLFGAAHTDPVDGVACDGTVLPNRALIVRVGGKTFADNDGPFVNATDGRDLCADSLMFVDGGILWTEIGRFDRIFGMCLSTGALTARRINSDVDPVENGGTRFLSSFTLSSRGQLVPDQDYLRLANAQPNFGAQFAFSGNEPARNAAGDVIAAGPDKVAFIAGESNLLDFFSNDTDAPIDGVRQRANENMSVFFLEDFTNGAGCLDLSASTLKDLTGNSSLVYGDILSPGRLGEELDFLEVSPDGRFVAAVRERRTDDQYSFTSSYPSFATGSTSFSFWNATDDLLIISTLGDDMHSTTGTDEHVIYFGTRSTSNGTTSDPSVPSNYAVSRHLFNAAGRRLNGLAFSEDSESLFVNYAGDGTYSPKYFGYSWGQGVNPELGQLSSSSFSVGTQMIARIDFRTSGGAAINVKGSMSNYAANALSGLQLQGLGSIGDTSPPFTDTHSNSNQQFWSTFKSANGKFLYYIVDQEGNRTNYMVGFNLTDSDIDPDGPGPIDPREEFVPFVPHADAVGFAQFESNAFNFDNRFASVPAGVDGPSGRDGDGIVCVIANDAAATAGSATDLEVYAFDANNGGELQVLTSDVTDGTSNAINHPYLSADGNVLIFQRSKTTANSSGTRAMLNGENDLCVVTNIHGVLFSGEAPRAFVVSEDKSHGSTVALIGEGTSVGPQAVVFSSGPSGGNASWTTRTLKVAILADRPTPDEVDSTQSHYVVLSAFRKIDDILTSGS